MKIFFIKDLAEIIKAPTSQSVLQEYFIGVSIDSRTIRPGDCFFAIAGENFDGHDYLPQAFSKGAACAVVSKDFDSPDLADHNFLKVEDTIEALGCFAAHHRRRYNFKVVAITGSVGKTTTRQITNHILNQYFRCLQSAQNFNNNIGLPLTLLGAKPSDQIIIVELGSNHPGEIAYLTHMAGPDVAVVTNTYLAHLAGFGDLQTIIREKLSISQGLEPGGQLIINGDIGPLVKACRDQSKDFVTFGKSDDCDIQAKDTIFDGFGSSFTIEETEIHLPLPGPGNIENALAAWSICSRFGIDINDFAQALRTLPPIAMRSELLKIGSLTVLNDCYNANPASMKNALEILANLGSKQKSRCVFICGDMCELGEQSEALHEELGSAIARAGVGLLVTVGQFAETTAKAAKAAADYDLRIKSFAETFSACNKLEEIIENSDIVLVKGSRSIKLEMVVEKLKELFA